MINSNSGPATAFHSYVFLGGRRLVLTRLAEWRIEAASVEIEFE
jgi:hypothetical protein